MPNTLDRKVYIVRGDGAHQVEEMFITEGWSITNDFDNADLIQFVGGADVNPSLYHQHKHKTTFFDKDRDDREVKQYLRALELGIPMAGICRGGQFLNVMNGGTLYQDVDRHALVGVHPAYLRGAALPIKVTSTHHQMMSPNYNSDVIVLMTAGESTHKYQMSYDNGKNYEIATYPITTAKTDVESLYYRDSMCLCFQPHPEYTSYYAQETREVYFQFLEEYIFNEEEIQLRDEA